MTIICNIGGGKPSMSFSNNLVMAFFAGCYIGFGCLLAIKTAGNLPVEVWGGLARLAFGLVFPLGLLLVLIAGADLFTGNCMYLPSAVMNGKANCTGLLRSWTISYFGNLAGSIFVAFFLGTMSEVLFTDEVDGSYPLAASAVSLANMKCSLSWEVAFIRAVGCNWLVCLAIYMSLAAPDAVSKAVVIWPPIAGFVVIGFEHSVANMTFIPLGIFLGQTETYLSSAGPVVLTAGWDDFFIRNLIPVTLGNIAGGMIFVGMLYYKVMGVKPGNK